MRLSSTLQVVIAVALSTAAAAGVAVSAVCGVVLAARLYGSGLPDLPPFTQASAAMLAAAFAAGCLLAIACHRVVRTIFRVDSIRTLVSRG